MEEPEVNRQLLKEDLFELFRLQLKKDFEGAGANGDFADTLPAVFDLIRKEITRQMEIASKSTASFIPSLLYRVDISEAQLRINHEKQISITSSPCRSTRYGINSFRLDHASTVPQQQHDLDCRKQQLVHFWELEQWNTKLDVTCLYQ